MDAIRIAVDQLANVPDSPEVQALRSKALAYEHFAQQWAETPPSDEQREVMMKKVLALHVAVTKLCRQQRGS